MAEMFPELSSKHFKGVRTIKTVVQLLCVCTNFLHTHTAILDVTMQCCIEFVYILIILTFSRGWWEVFDLLLYDDGQKGYYTFF